MTVVDRRADGYEPRFDIDLAVGAQAEMFVVNIIKSLGAGSGAIEVKYDARYQDTGKVYVEYQCRKRGKWTPSGIATTTADFWAFVLGMDAFLFIVATDKLKDAARRKWAHPHNRKELAKGSHPTRGVVMEPGWLAAHATKVPA